jgi:GNAT superfamily N-acetyltransferase
MEHRALRVEFLADHEAALPRVAEWFEREWPSYYGPAGPGDAHEDLRDCARREGLPVGFVAYCAETACGFAALKAESIASHRHLTPWAAAGLVPPEYRGRGVGTALMQALEGAAGRLGYERVYCATGTADRLLLRRGWQLLEEARAGEEEVRIYQKAL